ncbi:PadR family transcriptional regulator [Streptomyces purpureus]|uniref:PadR family transcriptional regulator n=1 Tax=Streptomyces purpureus TaxID=1951 RepID=UPI00379B9F1D
MTKELPDAVGQRHSQLLRGVLDICLLALIAERPRYGFEFTQALADGGLDLVREGSIYPLLSRLEGGGLVSSYRAPSASGGAPRKYYRLTEAGRVELDAGRAVWHGFAGAVSGLLTETAAEKTDTHTDTTSTGESTS